MSEFFSWWTEDVQTLLYEGGTVLQILFGVCILLWALILERCWFFLVHHQKHTQEKDDIWDDIADHHPHEALWVRKMWLSKLYLHTHRGIDLIACLIIICPLLGLLGTITGMMELFHTLSVTGSNSARALSSGIAHATLPTLGGLIVALSGYYFVTLFNYYAKRERMTMHRHLLLPRHTHELL